MPTIVLAGATGDLGHRIASRLRDGDTRVRALVRDASRADQVAALRRIGVEVVQVHPRNTAEIAAACTGADCVVSALSGLRDVIVEAQGALLDGAVAAGVPRFIPSDFAIDFTKLTPGRNRNLDHRVEFRRRLDAAPIRATSVMNGMFADLLTGQAPMVMDRINRVLYWGDADQILDFTTMDDTAAFTAAAARDDSTPRDLRISGDPLSARGVAAAASAAKGRDFKVMRAGSLSLLSGIIGIAKRVNPAEDEIYPAWQGMQYFRSMFGGAAQLRPLDNDRYPDLRWTSVETVLRRAG